MSPLLASHPANAVRLLILAAALAVSACDGAQGDTPQTARGDTPVKYIICGTGGTGCFIAARFKDLDGCQSHKELADMLCDRRSHPDKVVCTRDRGTQFAVAYCTL